VVNINFASQHSVTNEDLEMGSYQEMTFGRWMVLATKRE
jgi:hypothetical protein